MPGGHSGVSGSEARKRGPGSGALCAFVFTVASNSSSSARRVGGRLSPSVHPAEWGVGSENQEHPGHGWTRLAVPPMALRLGHCSSRTETTGPLKEKPVSAPGRGDRWKLMIHVPRRLRVKQ